MSVSGAIIAVWTARLAAVALFAAGTSCLIPLPPSLAHSLEATFLYTVALVPLTIGEFLAAFLALLSTAMKSKKRRVRDIKQIQEAAFSVFDAAATTLEKVYRATLGLGKKR